MTFFSNHYLSRLFLSCGHKSSHLSSRIGGNRKAINGYVSCIRIPVFTGMTHESLKTMCLCVFIKLRPKRIHYLYLWEV